MHAARGWLPTAIGMLLLVPPWSGLLVHAVAQSRTTPNTSRPTQTPTAQRPSASVEAAARPRQSPTSEGGPAKTVEPVSRIPQRPSPVPEASQHIPICIVPELTDAASARRDLTGKRLTLGSVEKVETDRHRSGIILKQSPAPGAKTKCGSDVDVWVAVAVPPKVDQQPESGGQLCRVPDLLEDLSKEVAPQLEGAKLRLGRVSSQESTHREGTVVRQVPSRGAEVKCGSAVDVWIAVAPPQPPPPIVDCHVPDLIEDLETSIEPQLKEAKLRLRNVIDLESNRRPGTVLRQLPPRGATVKCWSFVDVWIAVPVTPKPEQPRPEPPKPEPPRPDPPKPELPKPELPKPEQPKPDPPKPEPPKPVSVPSLEGRDQMTATRMLEAAGLHLGQVGRRPSDGPRDLVVAQSPRAGTPVQPETPVQVWLAEPVMVVVPDLRGGNQRSAAEVLASVGLVVGDVREREDSSARGTVLDQLPAPQSQVVAGTSVALSIAVPRVAIAPPPTVQPPPPVQPLPPVQPPPPIQPPSSVQPQTPVHPEPPVQPEIPVQPRPQAPSVQATSTPIAVAPVQVPRVVGLSLNQAFLRLESAGLRPGRVSELREATAAGNVTAQFPAAGSAATPGAQVDLVVAASPGISEWIASSPWIFPALAVGLLIAIAGSLAKAKPKVEPEPLPTMSFAPRADPGVQSAYAEDGVLARSEFRLDSRADAGIQTLHFSDRRVTGEA